MDVNDTLKAERIDWNLVNQIAGGKIPEGVVTKTKRRLAHTICPSSAERTVIKDYLEFRHRSYTPTGEDIEEIVNTGTTATGTRPSPKAYVAFEKYVQSQLYPGTDAPIDELLLGSLLPEFSNISTVSSLRGFLGWIPRPYTDGDFSEFYSERVRENALDERSLNWRNMGDASLNIIEQYLTEKGLLDLEGEE